MVLNEDLDIQLINKSMCRIVQIPDESYALGKNVTTILDPVDFCRALGGEKVFTKKTYLNDYDKFVDVEDMQLILDENGEITKESVIKFLDENTTINDDQLPKADDISLVK